ncbi:phage head closure protein [Citrobacter freundii]|uniref:phage head closure protein n=1 Tax=Citrobacter TaxID=544 RepID=UPI0010054F84|nr:MULTISPECIES: phage head closure protein [Citrobacter]MBJ9265216.1 phage head closure protein [Citrobacter braakii]MCT4736423.1 phage head closure protein [Citrobacter freundii]MDE9595544.1 phage head closure protein [Citrobacter freundii]MDE9715727.1 phage head closure protein [Citrobacter freundii]MDE9723619.1 phage head closure protein [Citrobacter freundii]
MQAGKLNKRITLQKPVKTQSSVTGAVVNVWADVAELWANVADLSARDFVAAQAGQSEVTTRITIRWRDDVTDKHRILYRGCVYDIQGVLEDDKSGREYLTLPCARGVNDG